MTKIRTVAAIGLGLMASGMNAAIAADEPAAPEDTFVAAPEDVESIDAIINAAYDVISGPKGQERDWARERSLFIDEARLMAASSRAPQGISVVDLDNYWERSHPYFVENGFYEREIGRKVDHFGGMAQVFSAYEIRNSLDQEEPSIRGINSFQLIKHEGRWWIVSIMWATESEDHPIPDEYLY